MLGVLAVVYCQYAGIKLAIHLILTGVTAFEAISYTVGSRQSKTALFDWTFFRLDSSVVLLIVSRVHFIVFVLLEAVGAREYCCMAVENRLAALCFARS